MRLSMRVLFACSLASLATLAAPAQPGTNGTALGQSFKIVAKIIDDWSN